MSAIIPTAASLRSCSLEELKKEPWRLQIQADTTAEQLRGLVLRNYHVFIQSNQSANIVKDELHELQLQTTEIMAAIPELKQFCASVQQETADIVAKHSDIQFVFDHYLELTELLEIPQLLEACVLNELFDAALDVIQLAHETFGDAGNKPSTSSSSTCTTNNFVIQALVREIAQMTTLLREKLLQKLRDDIPLSLCVRVVSYLRRLDVLVAATAIPTDGTSSSSSSSVAVGTPDYERQLKEEFLRCRSAWLASLARSISTADAYQYTIQLIDIKRTSWFDMITQYSAIFGTENVHGKVDPPLCRWATTTVADFIQVLMRQLPKIDDLSSLATVLEQSLFFGGSLGRVGVDFRAVLVVYFEDHVFDLMAQSWQSACRDFQDHLRSHALNGPTTAGPMATGTGATAARMPIVLASYRHHSMTTTTNAGTTSEEDLSPPRVLMAFPILAEFTNALLTSFNDLRLCTITSLHHRLATRLQHTLASMLAILTEFCRDNQLKALPRQSGDDTAATRPQQGKAAVLGNAIQDMNEVIATELLPYTARSFQRLFPVVASSTGRSSTGTGAAAARFSIDVASLTQQMNDNGLLVAADS